MRNWKGTVRAIAGGLLVFAMAAPILPGLRAQSPPLESGISFTDITKAANINFVHFKGNQGTSINLEEFGPGVCVSDFDNDGWPDIYFVNGRDRYGRGISVRNALYRNNRDRTFTDVTENAGVPGTGYGTGCIWGDYDNDGLPDLFVTQYGRNVLYHNNGNGTFSDVTDKAGVAGLESGKFHSGATFFDYDRDGLLDLYVGSYVALEPDGPLHCMLGTIQSSCAPSAYSGSPNALYHNNGDGTFTNVTKSARLLQPAGKNLAVGAADYDNDGWPDLFVANDGLEAYLFHNEHDGTFKEIAPLAGMAYGLDGKLMAAMCISLGDYDNDGWLDLYISDFLRNSDHLWHNDHKGGMDEVTGAAGLLAPTFNVLSFGGGFFDYDNDGWLDLFIANGHVYPEIELTSADVRYKQLNSLFHNQGDGKFVETAKAVGIASLPPRAGRGVAFADFDNDGFVDVLVANNGDPPTLLHNSGNANHFINLKLIGIKSNRDGMGARIRVTANHLSQLREIAGGGSYLSQSDLRANFGLGHATKAETVEIKWPSGKVDTFADVPADNFYMIEEGRRELRTQQIVRTPRENILQAPAHHTP